mmetsp:Transcript_31451/g.90847  ORF Transcript_31451/g.90847 Transcript_31451/m.90847 type:complete len:215 (+) Transcript_31451:55-699(+)
MLTRTSPGTRRTTSHGPNITHAQPRLAHAQSRRGSIQQLLDLHQGLFQAPLRQGLYLRAGDVLLEPNLLHFVPDEPRLVLQPLQRRLRVDRRADGGVQLRGRPGRPAVDVHRVLHHREVQASARQHGLEEVGGAGHVEVRSHQQDPLTTFREHGQDLPRILQRVLRPMLQTDLRLRHAMPAQEQAHDLGLGGAGADGVAACCDHRRSNAQVVRR